MGERWEGGVGVGGWEGGSLLDGVRFVVKESEQVPREALLSVFARRLAFLHHGALDYWP